MFNIKLSLLSLLRYICVTSLFFKSYILTSCTRNNAIDENKKSVQIGHFSEPPSSVSTIVVNSNIFQSELIANGKLLALEKSDLHFETSGVISELEVSEGQYVTKGQVIAKLDDTERKLLSSQLNVDKQKAQLEYEDQLLRLGYRLQDTSKLNSEIKMIARLRSGLTSVDLMIEKNILELNKLILRAPFAGYIANLKMRAHNLTNSNAVCTLLGSQTLIVEFKVLEQELNSVRKGNSISVMPFSLIGKTYSGQVISINPIVDGSGMVTVCARIQNDGILLDGMNVKISVKHRFSKIISLPKEAVLDRQDRKIVFTHKDGKAKWNYVKIAHENSTHFAISSGLEEGDEVIIKGNFNLAHGKNIQVDND